MTSKTGSSMWDWISQQASGVGIGGSSLSRQESGGIDSENLNT